LSFTDFDNIIHALFLSFVKLFMTLKVTSYVI
jgi:hypothetical protein